MRATRAQRAYHAVQARGLVRAWERHSERGNRPALTRPTGCGRAVVVVAAACRKLSACRICALLGHGLKTAIARRIVAASAPADGLARAWRPRDHVRTRDPPTPLAQHASGRVGPRERHSNAGLCVCVAAE